MYDLEVLRWKYVQNVVKDLNGAKIGKMMLLSISGDAVGVVGKVMR